MWCAREDAVPTETAGCDDELLNPLRMNAQMNVSLRPLEDRDLDTIYQQVTDPESVRMAAFTAEDQTDRRAFLNRTSRLRADTSVSHRVIEVDGAVAGNDRLLPNRQSA